MIQIEVVFARLGDQTIKTLMLHEGATVLDAVLESGLIQEEAQGDDLGYGVWSKVAPPTQSLKDGDRVEVYRPLTLDPKAKRQLIIKKRAWRKAGLRR